MVTPKRRAPRRATPWAEPAPAGLAIEVLGEIVPYVRVGQERFTPRAKMYHAWKAGFESVLRAQARRPEGEPGPRFDLPWVEGAIAVGLDIYRYSQRGDSDNLEKAIFDAANGVLWHDDAQVVESHVRLIPCAKGEDRALIDIVPDVEYAELLRKARR